MKFPKDIYDKIFEVFSSKRDQEEAINLLEKLGVEPLNVGRDQLARSLLVLSEGYLTKLKIHLKFLDPRDKIMEAEEKLGNPGHYFIPPFNQIEKR